MQAVRKSMNESTLTPSDGSLVSYEPASAESARVDVEALMGRIRQDVLLTLAASGNRFPKPPEAPTKLFDGKTLPLALSEELKFLNANWTNWLTKPEFSSHRPGVGKLIVKAKNYAARFVLEVCFKGFFKYLYDFNWNVVQHCNRSARYIDARDSEVLWQLVSKLDSDIQAINDKCDRLYDEVLVTLSAVETKLAGSSAEPVRDTTTEDESRIRG